MTPEAQGFIYDVWVTPERRGQGWGSSSSSGRVDWARRRGVSNDQARSVRAKTPGRATSTRASDSARNAATMGKRLE